MSKGHNLNFKCLDCSNALHFSVKDIEKQVPLSCQCNKKYIFTDSNLIRQMKKFEALCRQIHDSEEILGNACVGVDVGEHHVKVPYKLLLTRLSSSLELVMDGQNISITFRVEPTKDSSLSSIFENL